MPASKVKLLIADDHAVLRAGLKLLLNSEPDMEVVGEAANGLDAVRMVGELNPDILLLDISMPGLSGQAALRIIKDEHPEVKVLVVSMHEDESYVHEMLKAGADGYVPKKAADVELLAAIRATARGEHFIHASLTSGLISDFKPRQGVEVASELSQREREVLYLLARGYTNQETAERLLLSTKTVETYKLRIKDKLGLHGRAELVRYAMENGLMEKMDNPK
jgi:two-component system, NarL family, response regulator NreC